MHHQRGIRDCDNGYDLVERDGKKTCMKFIRESQDRYKNPNFNFSLRIIWTFNPYSDRRKAF